MYGVVDDMVYRVRTEVFVSIRMRSHRIQWSNIHDTKYIAKSSK